MKAIKYLYLFTCLIILSLILDPLIILAQDNIPASIKHSFSFVQPIIENDDIGPDACPEIYAARIPNPDNATKMPKPASQKRGGGRIVAEEQGSLLYRSIPKDKSELHVGVDDESPEQESNYGKQVGEGGSVTRPKKYGKDLDKTGSVTRPKDTKITPNPAKGTASLVFFYYGDSPAITLFQETTELYRAMKVYDYNVLLKHDKIDGKYIVSQLALSKADEVAPPTRENFGKYLTELTNKGYMIDVWIFSHGSKSGSFRASKGTDGTHDSISTSHLESFLEESGYSVFPIRMVYQVNCHGSSMVEAWRAIGAKVVVGSRQVNFYPYEFARFTTQWNKGKSVEEARDKSESNTPKGPARIYIRDIDAPKTKREGEWGGCPLGCNVLGTKKCGKECGEDYFTNRWGLTCWRGDGKSTMDYSSWKMVSGNGNINKSSKPAW